MEDDPFSIGENRFTKAIHLHGLLHSFVLSLASFLEKGDETDEWIVPGSSDQLPVAHKVRVVSSFLLRLYHHLSAIALLSLNGMAVQSKLQLRSLVEMAIDLRYIATRPNDLPYLYLLHEFVARFEDGKKLQDDGIALSNEMLEGLAALEPMVEEYLALLSEIDGKQIRKPPRQSWTTLSVYERAEKGFQRFQNNQNIYSLYKRLCISMHGEARSHKDYFRRINGNLSFRLGPSWHLEPYILYLTLVSAGLMISAASSMGAPVQLADFDLDLGLNQKEIEELFESDGSVESLIFH